MSQSFILLSGTGYKTGKRYNSKLTLTDLFEPTGSHLMTLFLCFVVVCYLFLFCVSFILNDQSKLLKIES